MFLTTNCRKSASASSQAGADLTCLLVKFSNLSTVKYPFITYQRLSLTGHWLKWVNNWNEISFPFYSFLASKNKGHATNMFILTVSSICICLEGVAKLGKN